MSTVLLVTLMIGLACAALEAAEPLVTHLFPCGGQAGTRTKVLCAEVFESWPVNVWTDDSALVLKPGETNGLFDVEIAGNARIGPHLVRMYDANGVSAPLLFVVGQLPEFAACPGHTNDIPSPVDLFPCVLNGLITETNRSDTHRLLLPEGCVLEVAVCAVGLDSPLRASLELLDDATNRIAFVESQPDRDPRLLQSIPKEGTYLLRIAGNAGTDPIRAQETAADPGVYRASVNVNTAPSPVGPSTESVQPLKQTVEMFRPMVAVRTLMVPSITRGVIAPAGRQIYYGFVTSGQERFSFRVLAQSIGSPLVPTLRILDPAMQLIAEAPPGGDAGLVWVSPAEGDYIVAVSDARGHGGPVYSFQLQVEVPKPFFRATLSSHTYRLQPGSTTTVAVHLSRPPTSTSVLQVSAIGLPDGVSATPQTAEPGTAEARLELRAGAGAGQSSRPFLVNVVNVGSVPPEVDFVRAPIKGRHAPPGNLLINETEHIWLMVGP